MTTADIIRRLCGEMFHTSFVMPNYTPDGWWECDLFELTAAGYFREHEVKVSRSDFLRDREKHKTAWHYNHATKRGNYEPLATKHEHLATGDQRGPAEFWFVTVAGVVRPGELPSWAGLRIATPRGKNSIELETVTRAPRLHTSPADSKLRVHAQSTAYWRMHRLIQKVGEL